MMQVSPIVLERSGGSVRLEPLALAHAEGLLSALGDGHIWRYLPERPPTTIEAMRQHVQRALDAAAAGTEQPFAIVHRASGTVAGSTRYLDIQPAHRGLEIGWTWLGTGWQRTAANTECKALLLGHAFEALGALRVQFKTDARNLVSQRAIERLGAVREGCLRQHRILPDGLVRDTVYYSVVAADWPAVRARLEAMLAGRPTTADAPSSGGGEPAGN